jgi:hypothetical protein
MRLEFRHYRHADKFLSHWPHWHEFTALASTISLAQIEGAQQGFATPAVGAQKATNAMFASLITGPKSWVAQAAVWKPGMGLPDRKMDFWKDELGIEIAFNNDSYLERIVLRLNAANTGSPELVEHPVAVGVVVVASQALKSWGSMDPSVSTFQGAAKTIELIVPSFSVPLALVGLFPDETPAAKSTYFGKKAFVQGD